jgi:hypothetical protein
MAAPETSTTSMSTSNSRKRGNVGSDSEKPTKRQKTLTKFEQQEALLREHAGRLKLSLGELKVALKAFSLLDGDESLRLDILSRICDEIQLTDHQRRPRQLLVLQDPILLLEGDALSGLTLSEWCCFLTALLHRANSYCIYSQTTLVCRIDRPNQFSTHQGR